MKPLGLTQVGHIQPSLARETSQSRRLMREVPSSWNRLSRVEIETLEEDREIGKESLDIQSTLLNGKSIWSER